MTFSRRTKTDLFIVFVISMAVALTALAVRVAPPREFLSLSVADISVLVAMLVFAIGMDMAKTSLTEFRFNIHYTIGGAVFIAMVIGYGTVIGIAATIPVMVVTEAWLRRAPKKLIFNLAQTMISTAAAGLVYHALAGPGASIPLESIRLIGFALLASVTYMLMNASLVACVVGISIGKSPVTVFVANLPGVLMQNVTLPSIGLLLTVVHELNPVSLIFFLLPLFGPFVAMRGHRETLQQIQRTIEALADTVDRRDVTTAQHSERVAGYVQQIIDEIGTIKFTEAEAIILAARVHDLGKIAIPDSVLLKPGRLDEEEYRLMRSHPVAGDEVLRNLSIYKDSLGVVRHHHERYDGKGYPDGMKGEEIPFGARIVGVADTYDVITSDRPYHRARSVREAKEELINCKGTQFDPMVVDAFIRVLDRVHGVTPVEHEASEHVEPLVPVAASR